ncbi:MAG: hypothetical protein JXR45_22870 [Deltaproteobacteria bacterium]|nr:hypothetical protein [Deltaproteobacteria bacterium]
MNRLIGTLLILCAALPAAAQTAAWTCPESYYGDDGCDCGCGELDVDCAGEDFADCEYNNCDDPLSPGYADNYNCYAQGEDPELEGWICPTSYYGDGKIDTDQGGCDCGCGIPDVDCPGNNLSVAVCEYDSCPDGQSPGLLDNTTCNVYGSDPDLGSDWTCASYYWVDDECDCGCGSVDDGCSDATSESCDYDYCDAGTVVAPDNNGVCTSTIPDSDSDTVIGTDDSDTAVASDSDSSTESGTDTSADTDSGRDIVDRELPPVVDETPSGDSSDTGDSGCAFYSIPPTSTLFRLIF